MVNLWTSLEHIFSFSLGRLCKHGLHIKAKRMEHNSKFPTTSEQSVVRKVHSPFMLYDIVYSQFNSLEWKKIFYNFILHKTYVGWRKIWFVHLYIDPFLNNMNHKSIILLTSQLIKMFLLCPFGGCLQIVSVHDFNPTCISINPNLTIIFFHNVAFGKETWTSQSYGEEELVCWPEKWLLNDLGENVRILSVSCDATFHTDLMEIDKYILHSLMSR
jgi:hypothetical protein